MPTGAAPDAACARTQSDVLTWWRALLWMLTTASRERGVRASSPSRWLSESRPSIEPELACHHTGDRTSLGRHSDVTRIAIGVHSGGAGLALGRRWHGTRTALGRSSKGAELTFDPRRLVGDHGRSCEIMAAHGSSPSIRDGSWEIMGDHVRSWEIMGDHGRSWEIMGDHGSSPSNRDGS